MAAIHETREGWLMAAVELMRREIDLQILLMDDAPKAIAFPDIADRVGAMGEPLPTLPTNLRVACSNPSGGIRNRVRGECVSPDVSSDGSWAIWISPKVDDVQTVLLVLLHELIHATLEDWQRGAGHGPRFWRLARVLGFARPLTTATIATGELGAILRTNLTHWSGRLGDYPHAGVNFAAHDATRRRQSTRMLKAECLTDGCGFKVRLTRTWAQRATPLCPVCEGMGVHSRTAVLDAGGAIELCQLAGVTVLSTGEDDAEAVERAAVLRAEREERERQAREARARAAADARREARAREAAVTEAAAQRTANARAAGLGEAADLGVVEGQGVQNRYGDSQATRDRRAAERAARPVASFDGVEPGTATVRHLIELATPGVLAQGDAADMNDIEDATRRYCDRNGIRPVGRFTLVQALRAGGASESVDEPAPAPARRTSRRSARFANLDFD